jgi:hypothetical protein
MARRGSGGFCSGLRALPIPGKQSAVPRSHELEHTHSTKTNPGAQTGAPSHARWPDLRPTSLSGIARVFGNQTKLVVQILIGKQYGRQMCRCEK